MDTENKATLTDPQLASESPGEALQTTCCVVGSGPAGALLALLLARKGVRVDLLEAHLTFDREFRADTVHPSILQNLEEIGLIDGFLKLPHSEMKGVAFATPQGKFTISDFSALKRTRYPYIALLPQAEFLSWLTSEAKQYPHFHLQMGARVEDLIVENGQVRGVRYRGGDGMHDVRALLTVAADGRFSRVRRQAGMNPVPLSEPMDVLWFNIPRQESDPDSAGVLHLGPGHFAILFDKGEYWQVGFAIPPGSYQRVRAGGVQELSSSLQELIPWFADRMSTLQEWDQVTLLSVVTSRLKQWYRPGLLLIGDAAHVMNPIGGFGINLASQDAVVAANVLAEPLLSGSVAVSDLAKVQRQRELPTKITQKFQTTIQARISRESLNAQRPFQVPFVFRLLRRFPPTRNMQAKFTAFGIRPPHVR